eukprot:6485422-Amphidinium_carterae.3
MLHVAWSAMTLNYAFDRGAILICLCSLLARGTAVYLHSGVMCLAYVSFARLRSVHNGCVACCSVRNDPKL